MSTLSAVEEKLDETLKKGDFDAIVEQLTPKILTSCKTNALLKSLKVSLRCSGASDLCKGKVLRKEVKLAVKEASRKRTLGLGTATYRQYIFNRSTLMGRGLRCLSKQVPANAQIGGYAYS